MNDNSAPIFEVGDAVELKTGSAKLCVRSVEGDQVTVDWFEGEKAKTKTFAAGQLQRSEPGTSSSPRLSRLVRSANRLLGLDEFRDSKFDALIEGALNHDSKSPKP